MFLILTARERRWPISDHETSFPAKPGNEAMVKLSTSYRERCDKTDSFTPSDARSDLNLGAETAVLELTAHLTIELLTFASCY